MKGLAFTTFTISIKPTTENSTIKVSANVVFFITAPPNTNPFHVKSSFCKETLTQKTLTG
jgi:hypothetical protein